MDELPVFARAALPAKPVELRLHTRLGLTRAPSNQAHRGTRGNEGLLGRAGVGHNTAFTAAAAALALVACGPFGGQNVVTNPPVTKTQPTVTAVPSSGQTSGLRTVIAPLGINLRSADSHTSSIVGSAAQDTQLTVTAQSNNDGGWFSVHGSSLSGWISSSPNLSDWGTFSQYQSPDALGFSCLYPDSWTFAAQADGVEFHLKNGGAQVVAVHITSSPSGLTGLPGYDLVNRTPVEVFGITGTLTTYDRNSSPMPSPGTFTTPHVQEITLRIDSARSMKMDAQYDNDGQLGPFHDIYLSMSFTPSPSPSALPNSSPTP